MSGTSCDGVDAALLKTDGEEVIEFLGALTLPYPQDLRSRLLQAATSDVELSDLLLLERELTEVHVEAITVLLDKLQVTSNKVDVIGFHGHTIRHLPAQSLTWQLGNPAQLAAATSCDVVHDFRRADLLAGGQGAPLAPLFHYQICQPKQDIAAKPTAILNIGGVGNLTWIGQAEHQVFAGDTGPGCGLIDQWTQEHFGQPFDHDGQHAARGQVHWDVVSSLLSDSFFQRPLPKSADRFQFAKALDIPLSPEDGLATLCAFTAGSAKLAAETLPSFPRATYVTGGGARNPVVMTLLREAFGKVEAISELGLRIDSLEAECFAWLAIRRIRNLPTSLPSTTGCSRPVSGGSLTPVGKFHGG